MTDIKTTGFHELNEQDLLDTEGGIIGTIIIVGLAVGALVGSGVVLGGVVNDTRRSSAQADANTSGQPVTVTLLGFGGPTYTATPDPNYKNPMRSY